MEPGNQTEQSPRRTPANPLLKRPAFWALAAEEKKTRMGLLGECLRFAVVYLVGTLLQSLLVSIPMTAAALRNLRDGVFDEAIRSGSIQTMVLKMAEQLPDWMTIVVLFCSAALGAAAIYHCRKKERRSLASMGLIRRGLLPELIAGLAAGLVFFAAVVLLGRQVGAYTLSRIFPARREAMLLALALIGCLVSGAAREILLRGYFAPTLNATLPVVPVLLTSTLMSLFLFGGAEMSALTVGNTVLMNLALCILTIKRGSLWAAIGLQGGWLFCLNFLFGFQIADGDRLGLFRVDSAEYRTLLTGGVNGPESSICATVVWIVVLAAVLALPQKNAAGTPAENAL